MLSRIKAGTSGFRGLTMKEITPSHALALGQLYGEYLREKFGAMPRLAVGHDQRYGASELARAAIVGILSAGGHVLPLGCVSTGVFSTFMTETAGMHGAILITGSHMPWERIGIILMNADGSYCDTDITDEIERRLVGFIGVPSGELTALVSGRISHIPTHVSAGFYVDQMRALLNAGAGFPMSGRKVLIDPGNGTAGEVARHFLEILGCDVHVVNFDPKPIPDRPSECRPESCEEAMRLTREWGCDVGFAFDGDADRVLVITEEGMPIPMDVVNAIMARAALRKGDVCVTPVDSSGLMDVVCREIGATLVRCRIGQPATGTATKKHDAAFACEATGKLAWPNLFPWYDGVFAAAQMLKLMVESRRRMSELSDGLPTFHKMERGLPLPAERKVQVVERVFGNVRGLFAAGATMDTLDGLRFTFPDDSWLLLRPSGTEPKFRWYADSTSEERTKRLMNDAERLIVEAIG